jgi:preprotein translocase subunit SecF
MISKEKLGTLYDKNYKKLLIIPAVLLALSFFYLAFFYIQTGDIVYKDVSLTGGVELEVFTDFSAPELESLLSSEFNSIMVTAVSNNAGIQRELIITFPNQDDSTNIDNIKNIVGDYIGIELDDSNSSVRFTGSTLAQDFYKQLLRAVIFAFLLMALVVFFVFGESRLIKAHTIVLTFLAARLTFSASDLITALALIIGIVALIYALIKSKTKQEYIYALILLVAFFILFFIPYYLFIIPITVILLVIYSYFSVPSIAVILSAFADILMPLAIINLIGMQISAAGIVAFLMLIGYSVDTDILLTTRVLRRKNTSINSAVLGALKTGMTMTLTSLMAILIAFVLVYNFQTILNQIFLILIIGLSFDILNTWITNASLIKWYAEIKQ